MLKIQHSNHFVFVNQRRSQLRTGLGIQPDITRILVDVRNQHRLPVLDSVAYQSFTKRDIMLKLNVFLKAQREPVL